MKDFTDQEGFLWKINLKLLRTEEDEINVPITLSVFRGQTRTHPTVHYNPTCTLRHSVVYVSLAIMTIPARDATVCAPSSLLPQCSGTTPSLFHNPAEDASFPLLPPPPPPSPTPRILIEDLLGMLQVSSHHHINTVILIKPSDCSPTRSSIHSNNVSRQ